MLSRRIMTLFVLIATGPPAILGIVLYLMTKGELQESATALEADMQRAIFTQLLGQNEALAQRVALQLEERLNGWHHQLRTVASLSPETPPSQLLQNLIDQQHEWRYLVVYNASGEPIAANTTRGSPLLTQRLPQEAMTPAARGYHATLVGAPDHQQLLHIILAVGDPQSPRGYLAAYVELESLRQLIRLHQDLADGYLYTATADGQLIQRPPGHLATASRDPHHNYFTRADVRPRGTFRTQDTLIGYALVEPLGWRIVAILSLDEALVPVDASTSRLRTTLANLLAAVRHNTLLLIVAFLLLAAGTAHYMARDIVYPIKRVVTGIRQIARGDLDSRVPVHRQDEIGFLADSFNRMAEELRHSREELVVNRHRTEHILDSLSESLIMLDSEGRVSGINPTAAETLGYSPSDLVGRPASALFDAALWPTEMNQLILREELNGKEAIILTSYGERYPVLVSSSILRDRAGQPVGAVIVARDITDQIQVEEDRRRLAAIVQGSADLIATLSLEGNLLFLNQAGRSMLRIDNVSQLLGHTLADFCAPDQQPTLSHIYKRLPQDGHAEAELTLIPLGDDRHIPALVTFTQLKDPKTNQPTLIAAIGRDITERQEALDQLQRYAKELENSNRELEQFAFVASHDLREPLRKLNNLAELLQRRYDDRLDDKGRQMLQFMTGSAQRMLSLIKDLLEYSRVGTRAKDFQPADLNLIVDTALSDLSMIIRETKAQFRRDNLPTLPVDSDQIALLFQNLISNAIKFRGQAPPDIHILAHQQDDTWTFAVRDHGIGIDPVHRDRIFVIFQRLDPDQEGTGIGLAICKKIIERHGGRIWVESEPGQGATFYFTIPKTPPQPSGDTRS